MRYSTIFFALLVASMPSAWATDAVAATPPMGWNSWDCYGTTVTEAEVKANADHMAQHLQQHGWQYVVIDIQWSEPNAQAHGYRPGAQLSMDEYGRLIPAVNRIPPSAGARGWEPVHRRNEPVPILGGRPRLPASGRLH